MHEPAEYPELGRDPLDVALTRVERRWWSLPARSPALGLGSLGSPAFVYVLVGVALGPSGLNLLTDATLNEAQAIAWVGLAVLGVFVGIGLHTTAADAPAATVTTAAVIGVITVATIAGGLIFELGRGAEVRPELLATPVVAAAILIGVCSAVSGALHPRSHAAADVRAAARLADLDDVPLVLAGTALVAALVAGPILWRLAATLLGGAAVGIAGWLLFDRATDAERGLYLAGTILLLAGIGAYLGTSPLLAGLIAATVWARLPGPADRLSARDLRPLQHPLTALLLLIAGAFTRWDSLVLWVTAWVVVLRLVGKLVATLATSRFAQVSPSVLASVILYPGVMGIALALNARLLLGEEFGWVLSTVTVSTVIAEIVAAFLPDVESEGP